MQSSYLLSFDKSIVFRKLVSVWQLKWHLHFNYEWRSECSYHEHTTTCEDILHFSWRIHCWTWRLNWQHFS